MAKKKPEKEQTPTFAERAIAKAEEREALNTRYREQREEDLRRRAERRAMQDFELDAVPVVEIENGEAYTEIDGVRLHYVGNPYDRRVSGGGRGGLARKRPGTRTGKGFTVQEACAACGNFGDVVRVEDLAELGVALKSLDEIEWECSFCNDARESALIEQHSQILRESIERSNTEARKEKRQRRRRAA